MQAEAALLQYVRQRIAPRVQTGGELLAQFHRTRLLPTGCARSADLSLAEPCKTLHNAQSFHPDFHHNRLAGWLKKTHRGATWPEAIYCCCSINDILLRGGVREEHHVELTGECGSGKTQLCMQVSPYGVLTASCRITEACVEIPVCQCHPDPTC